MDDIETFVRVNGPGLARFAYLLCGDKAAAEDLVQATLLKTHRSWDRIAPMHHPLAYVRRILSREYVSLGRLRRTSEIVTERIRFHENAPDPAEVVAESDAVWSQLQSLPKRQRTVLVMRYYVDLTDADIAELLGCSKATVRSHAARALQTLRRTMPAQTEEVQP